MIFRSLGVLYNQCFQFACKLLYPPHCRACKNLLSTDKPFCSNCLLKVISPASLIIPLNQSYSMTVFAASIYQEPVRSLILRKATLDILAFEQCGRLILEKTPIKNFHLDYVVPIPLHWGRYAVRGFNQSAVVGSIVAHELDIQLIQILKRIRRTQFQSRLNYKMRALNVKNVFEVKKMYELKGKELLEGKHILLVDDLCTTGATLKNAAQALIPLKPASITAVVTSRAI